MNKQFKLSVVILGFFAVCHSYAGNIKDGYKSIGYWGTTKPAIEASKAQTDRDSYFGYISFKQKIVNNMANTQTTIESSGSVIVKIVNSRHGSYEINSRDLLGQVLKKDFSKEKISTNIDVVVLPNDNILLTLEIFKTDIVGALKLPDRVVNTFGYPFVIEGATIPVKDTEVKNIGFILDCNNQYKIINAFPIPDYDDIIPSVNGRLFFKAKVQEEDRMGEFVKRFRNLYCYSDKGVFMWSDTNVYNEKWIYGMQETKNTLYLVGAYRDGKLYPFWQIINSLTGETLKQYKNTTNPNIVFGNCFTITGILPFGKDGIQYWDFDNGTRYILKYTDEDKKLLGDNLRNEQTNALNQTHANDSKPLEEIKKYIELGDIEIRNGQNGLDYYKKADKLFEEVASQNGNDFNTLNWWLTLKLKMQDVVGGKPIAEKIFNMLEQQSIETNETMLISKLLSCVVLHGYYYTNSNSQDKTNFYRSKVIETAHTILKINPNNELAKGLLSADEFKE